MATYEYRCPQCQTKFEALRSYSKGRYARCPKCNHRAYKIVSPFSFKMDNIFTRDGEGFTTVAMSKQEKKERIRGNAGKYD